MKRKAFTLMEMMIVMAVISILVALLLPAVISARRSVYVAATATEITRLSTGLMDFKNTYGTFPPSHFTLHITPTAWANDAEQMAFMRQMCPNFDLGAWIAGTWTPPWMPDPAITPAPTPQAIRLSGSECLVFFLAGMPSGYFGKNNPTVGLKIGRGFSKNPNNPFLPPVGDESREGPYYEFKPSRFVDVDGDGMAEYADALNTGTPYLYACSDNKGYAMIPEKDNLGNPNPNCGACPDLVIYTDNPLAPTANDPAWVYTYWNNTYTGTASYPLNLDPQNRAINHATFQIVSAGWDGKYGTGGMWDEAGITPMIKMPQWIVDRNAVSPPQNGVLRYTSPICNPGIIQANVQTNVEARKMEVDNLTNFHNGSLGR